MARRVLPLVACCVAVVLSQQGMRAQDAPLGLEQRHVQLPRLGPDEACPVSVGTRETVPRQPHIFGAAGVWFGSGPVYLSLAWKASRDDDARFALMPVGRDAGAYRAKTPWVSVPSYSGPVLIRGHALDASGRALRFGTTNTDPRDRLQLRVPEAPATALWSFWPTSMWVPGPGCYGVQIDTLTGTDTVVFEAT